jgi:para-nitrobenzyl esterase
LFLDIYAPQETKDKKAVMVFIHGGAYTFGQASYYESYDLAQTGQVIVVVMQFRMGPFGFLGAD